MKQIWFPYLYSLRTNNRDNGNVKNKNHKHWRAAEVFVSEKLKWYLSVWKKWQVNQNMIRTMSDFNGFLPDSLYQKKIGEDLVLIMPYQSLNR